MDKNVARLLEVLQKKRISITDFSTETEISKDKIYAWKAERGNPKTADSEKIQIWLSHHSDDIAEVNNFANSYLNQRRDLKNTSEEFRVPLVTVKARAGYVASYDNIDIINSLDKYAIPPGVSYSGAIWRYFEVDGESMEPALSAGDHVLCSQVPAEDWDNIKNFYVYVLVTANMITIKRVFVKDTGEWVLISDNEQLAPQKLFDKTMLKELWVFRRLIKKTISAKKEFKIKI